MSAGNIRYKKNRQIAAGQSWPAEGYLGYLNTVIIFISVGIHIILNIVVLIHTIIYSIEKENTGRHSRTFLHCSHEA